MIGLLALAGVLYLPTNTLPPSTPEADKAIAADLKASPDQPVPAIAALPIRRDGRVLQIGTNRFVDEGDCDGPDCRRYRFDRLWPNNLIGVVETRYEGSDYWIVGSKNDTTAIGARPIPSPTGKYLFVGFADDLDGSSATGIPESITIWRAADMQRIRLIDDPVTRFDHFVGWHGDGCVEFVGRRDLDAPKVTYWLVAEKIDWVLHDRRPAICTGR